MAGLPISVCPAMSESGLIRVTGVVIRQRDIGEHDRILTLLTREHGILEASAPGIKKVKSKLSGHAQLFGYSEFLLFQGRKNYRVRSAQSIRSFFHLRQDVVKMALASYFCDLMHYISPAPEDAWNYQRLLLNTLALLEEDRRDERQLRSIFEWRLLRLAGFAPNLVACDGCGAYQDEGMLFLPMRGVLCCSKCVPHLVHEETITTPVPPAVLQALRHILYAPDDRLFSFRVGEESLERLNFVTEQYLELHTNTSSKALKIYKELVLPAKKKEIE